MVSDILRHPVHLNILNERNTIVVILLHCKKHGLNNITDTICKRLLCKTY